MMMLLLTLSLVLVLAFLLVACSALITIALVLTSVGRLIGPAEAGTLAVVELVETGDGLLTAIPRRYQ
jgi:hypothetical protein